MSCLGPAQVYNVNHGSNSWPMMRRYVIPMNVEHSGLKNSGGNSPTMPMAITCSRQKCSNLPDQGSAHEKVSFSVLSKLIRHRKTKPARVHVPVARNAASNTGSLFQKSSIHQYTMFHSQNRAFKRRLHQLKQRLRNIRTLPGMLTSSTPLSAKQSTPIRSSDEDEPNVTRRRLLHP